MMKIEKGIYRVSIVCVWINGSTQSQIHIAGMVVVESTTSATTYTTLYTRSPYALFVCLNAPVCDHQRHDVIHTRWKASTQSTLNSSLNVHQTISILHIYRHPSTTHTHMHTEYKDQAPNRTLAHTHTLHNIFLFCALCQTKFFFFLHIHSIVILWRFV